MIKMLRHKTDFNNENGMEGMREEPLANLNCVLRTSDTTACEKGNKSAFVADFWVTGEADGVATLRQVQAIANALYWIYIQE